MQKITPFLWFDGQAEEAARFYVSIFKKSRLVSVSRSGEGGPGKKGPVMSVSFRLEGQEFNALNGGPQYAFTPAISLLVDCATQREVDTLWRKLSRGGTPLQCGWITDRFGVTWQIVPSGLGALIRDPAVLREMLTMVKLDLARLKRVAARSAARRAAGKP